MSKSKKNANEWERSWKGCYGVTVTGEELKQFLLDCFDLNESAVAERFSTCIWGHSGIGKTSVVKQLANHPVVWRGKEYPGYKVYDVPVAQFEEMGDLHGMPSRHVLVRRKNGHLELMNKDISFSTFLVALGIPYFGKRKAKKIVSLVGSEVERWVPEEVLPEYRQDGWEIVYDAGVRTMYAQPDWVPQEEGPSILLLDDWNRPSLRILKGLMQLFQNYGMVSWSLPAGCNIVMTGNPDEQDYLVTSIDAAILTRIRHVTMKEDPKEWSVWAAGNGVDGRGINYVLRYPENMVGPELTNPRTLAEFFRYTKCIDDISDKANSRKMEIMGNALLDEQTVTSIMVFFSRDVELVAEPEQILAGDAWAISHTKDLMSSSRKEKRLDIVGVMVDRLYAHIFNMKDEPTKEQIANFQRWITLDCLPDDLRHNICFRMVKSGKGNALHKWLWGNDMLKKLILKVV